MTKEHETDIHWFKKTYKYLAEECGWPMHKISEDVGMSPATVQRFVTCTKNDFPRLRTSSIALIQDFVKKHKQDVIADDSLGSASYTEMNALILEENGRSGNMESPKVQPMLLGDADTWDLLKALSKREGVKVNITVSTS